MIMPIQDDSREKQMIDKFNLIVPENRSRADIDAHLEINGMDIPFELKSTTNGSIATARDFGMGHINKWRNIGVHWLFGFYMSKEDDPDYFIYCSPDDMESWYVSMEKYIKPDLVLGQNLPGRVDTGLVHRILGKKPKYSYQDAYSIMKRQYTEQQYKSFMDIENGYTAERMRDILQDRANYVIARGSTLNNPHIPANYFEGMTRITDEPAHNLRIMVHDYLKNNGAIEEAAA